MIYLIILFVLIAAGAVIYQMKSAKKGCMCSKCNSENCKCEENKCDSNCVCHDEAVVETPNPYLNGHSEKITIVGEVCDDTCACPDEPKTEEAPEGPAPEEPKEEPKKAAPKKKAPKKKNNKGKKK